MQAEPIPVVIVNYNSGEWTIECLRSLVKVENPSVRPIVVDSASSDDSVERIREVFPDISILVASTNRGFGAAANIGIGVALHSDADYVWLLNNDTEVDPLCLKALVAKAEAEPAVGLVGAMVYEMEERDRVQVSGGGYVFRHLGLTGHHRSVRRRLDFISGVSMLIRREVLEGVGAFDERFFLYCEDVDLCIRAVRDGWQLAVEPAARVWHWGGASTAAEGSHRSAAMDRIVVASAIGLIRKHGGRAWPIWTVIRLGMMTLRRLVPHRLRTVTSILQGASDGIRAFS